MITWRFSQHAALDGRGGLYTQGRWHSRGREILYCAPNPATALLEVMVHGLVRVAEVFADYQFLKLDLPDSISIEDVDELPDDWKLQLEVTRELGDRWLKQGRVAVLRVPSVLVPETANHLVNPLHPEARQISLQIAYRFALDARLLNPPART